MTAAADPALVAIRLDGRLCGIPVAEVRDVLGPAVIAPVPLAPPEIAGLFALRGRIVTAIDLRRRLGAAPRPAGAASMTVVMERRGELYGLIVDSVAEVLHPPAGAVDRDTAALDPPWRGVAAGTCRLDRETMPILNGDGLLDYGGAVPA